MVLPHGPLRRNEFEAVDASHARQRQGEDAQVQAVETRCCRAPTARRGAATTIATMLTRWTGHRGIHFRSEAAQGHECGEQDEG